MRDKAIESNVAGGVQSRPDEDGRAKVVEEFAQK